MTVPMSRPSSTAPLGRAAKSRCARISAARTSGIAATTEAASPMRAPRSAFSSNSDQAETARGGDGGLDVVQALSAWMRLAAVAR